VKGIRAKAPREEDMGVPCMDIACLGAVLVSRTRDEIGRDEEVSVDADDLLGRALGEHLGNGRDVATRLRHDKSNETKAWAQMGAPHTKNRSRLRRSL
jgi:hypothetical protein